jgi:hypothetical protein
MRAFRPSAFSEPEAEEEQAEEARKANVTRYQRRAQAGLPLFEPLPLRQARSAEHPQLRVT